MTRTDQDKITKAPIELTFGDQKYQVKPLTINPAAEWRAKLTTEMGPIADEFQSQTGQVAQTLAKALLNFPEKVRELVYSYAPNLPQTQIDEIATDEQFAQAFQDIMVVAYPYLASVLMVTRVVPRQTSSR